MGNKPEPKIDQELGPKKGWNIRPFPEDLKIECQKRALDERKHDYEWVAEKLRKSLAEPLETPVVDSGYEGGQTEVRRSTGSLDPDAAAHRNKNRAKKGLAGNRVTGATR